LYSFEHKILAILVSLSLLALSYSIRRAVGTYIFPAALFSIAWFLFTFVPLVLLLPIPINSLSVLFILACSLSFSFSAVFFDWKKAFSRNTSKGTVPSKVIGCSTIRHCLYGASVLSIVFSTLSIMSSGFDLRSVIFDLIETSGSYAALRGHEDVEYGLLGLLSIFFTNLAPALGGLIYSSERLKGKGLRVLALSIGPAVYYMLTQSTKLALMLAIAIWISSVMLAKILNGDLSLFKRSEMSKWAIYAVVLLPLISLSFLTRQGYSDYSGAGDALNLLSYLFLSYAVGQIYAFSDFFSYYIGMESSQSYRDDYLSLGYYSFKSIFDAFGGTKYFPPGYYDENFSIGDLLSTNIFTVFRSLIYDFGLLGSVVFMFCFGFVVHASYYRLLVAKKPWFNGAAFIVFSVFIFMSYLYSVFSARYMFLLGLGVYAILAVSDLRTFGLPRVGIHINRI
jgi:oligosaccharide repeat unit polymerase